MLGLVGKEGSKLRYSEQPQGWNVVKKDLLLPALIVGPFTKAPYGWALVCSVLRLLSNNSIKSSLFDLFMKHPDFFKKSIVYE